MSRQFMSRQFMPRQFVNLRRLTLVMACMAAYTVAIGQVKKSLDIYFIDVEGGQSTLVVTPNRQSLLIDTGWAGDGNGFKPGDPHQARDANRIVAAARDAGVSRIDYLLLTHFHPDHDGGLLELSKLMPIGTFVDHGTVNPDAMSSSTDIKEAFDAYLSARGAAKHLQPKPGDQLPIAGLDVVVVSSAGSTLPKPLASAGEANAACPPQAPPARDLGGTAAVQDAELNSLRSAHPRSTESCPRAA
jgi:competence protein ComEC